MLAAHGKTAGLALLLLLIWGGIHAAANYDAQHVPVDIEIGVEHQSPLAALSFKGTTGGEKQLMDIGNESDETLQVSLPASWERTEVRNVPLASLTSEEPSFGYRKWQFPAGASVSFETNEPWKSVTVHNPSGIPLRIRVTKVNLHTEQAEFNVYLAKDKPVKVW